MAQLVGAILASVVLMSLLEGFDGYEVEKQGLAANGNPREMTVGALLGWEVVMTALFLLRFFP